MDDDRLAGKLGSIFFEEVSADPEGWQNRPFEGFRSTAATTSAPITQAGYGTILRGDAEDDVLRGGKGPDRAVGRGGDDRLFGGAENDKLFGGRGADVLVGGAGRDRLQGGDGADRLFGGRGADRIMADGSDKLIKAGSGQDKVIVQLSGETGQMTRLFGGSGVDELVLKIDYDAYGPDQSAGVLADLAALAAHIEAGKKGALALRTLGIKVKGFETFTLRESGDRPIVANDDQVAASENTPVTFFPLQNDEGAASLGRINGQEVEAGDAIVIASGLLELGADGAVRFTASDDAQRLGDGERTEDAFTYQARNAAGALGPEATVRLIIDGASDPVIVLPGDGVPETGASGAPLTISGVAIDLPQNDSGVVDVVVSTENGEIAFTDDTDTSRLTLTDNDGSDGEIAFSGAPDDVTGALANSLLFTSKSGFSGVARINVTANDSEAKDVKVEEIIEIAIDLTDAPPVLDLNGDAAGTGTDTSYRAGRGPVKVLGEDFSLSDPNGPEIAEILIKVGSGAISGDRLSLADRLTSRIGLFEESGGLNFTLRTSDGTTRSNADFEEALSQLQFDNADLEAADGPLDPGDIRLVDRVFAFNAVDPEGNAGPGALAMIEVEQNLPPVVEPIVISIDEDGFFQANIVAEDPNGDFLAFDLSPDQLPELGVATVNKEGFLTYQGDINQNGEDAFVILVSDGEAVTAETVKVFVAPVNDAPVFESIDIDLPLTGVLQSGVAAKDPENQPLTFSLVPGSGPTKGQIDFRDDGSFTYRVNFLEPGGVDEFTFTVSDGELTVTDVARINIPQGIADFAFPDAFTVAPDGEIIGGSLVENDRTRVPGQILGDVLVFDGLETVDGFELVAGEDGQSLQPVSVEVIDPSINTLLTELGGEVIVRSRGGLLRYTPPETFVDENGVERDTISLAPGEEIIDRFAYRLSGFSIIGLPSDEPFSALTVVEITIRQPDATPVLDLNGLADGLDAAAVYRQGEGGQAIIGGDVSITDDDSDAFAFVRLTLRNADGDPDTGGALGLSEEVAAAFDLIVEEEAPEAATVYRLQATSGEAVGAAALEAALQGVLYENTAIDMRGATTGPGADFRDRLVEAVISDGELLSAPATLSIAIDPIDPPVLDLNGAAEGADAVATYAQGDGAQALFGPDVTITSDEGDAFEFVRLELTVPDAGGANPFDRLELTAEAAAAFDLRFEGLFDDIGALYRLSPRSGLPETAAAFETALQGVRFLGQGIDQPDIPGGGDLSDRLVRASIFDGVQASLFAETAVAIEPNDPPSLDLNGADEGVDSFARYRPGDGPQDVFLDGGVITDDANSQIEFIRFELGFADGDSIDVLSQLTLDDFTSAQFALSFDGIDDGDAIYRLSALDGEARSPGAFGGALRGVEFANLGLDNPDAAEDLGLTPDFSGREVAVQVFDAFGGSNVATVQISSVANIAPTLDGVGGFGENLTDYFQGDGAQTIFPDATRVIDPDSETLAFITFSLTADRRPGDIRSTLIEGDRLELIGASAGDFVLDGPDVTPPIIPGGAPLFANYTLRPLSGAASLASFDAALQDLHFFSQGLEDPATADPLDLSRLATPRFIGVTLSDGIDTFDFGQLTLAIDPNGAPSLDVAAFATDEDQPLASQLVGVDPDGRAVTFSLGDQAPELGDIDLEEDGAFTYTPDANIFGEDSFTVDLTDGFNTVEATITITIDPVNDAPVAEDLAATAVEGETVTGQVGATDVEGDEIIFTSLPEQAPSSGSLTLDAAGAFTFTPDPGFVGDVTFGFTGDDQNGGVDTGEVTLTFTAAPAGGLAPQADAATTDEDVEVLIDVLANDDIGANGTVTLSVSAGPAFGEALVQDGQILYRPDADASGQDSFAYRIEGDLSGAATQEVTVSVAPIADAPTLTVSPTLATDDGFAPRQRVNDETAFDQDQPQILRLATGELLYVYRVSDDSTGEGPHIAFRIGVAAADGSIAFGEEHAIPDEGDGSTIESRPQAIQLASGEVLIAWDSAAADGSATGVRVADIALTPTAGQAPSPVIGAVTAVNQDAAAGHGEVQLTQLSGGDVLFVWTHDAIDGDAGGIAARRAEFDPATGFSFGDVTRVNDIEAAAQSQPKVAELPDGRLLFVWRSDAAAADGDGAAIVARIATIGVGGALGFGDEILINQTTAGDQTAPDVAVLSTGDLVFLWDDGQAVRSRIGELDGTGGLALNDEFVASLLSSVEVHRSGSVIETTPGRLLYTWVADAVGERDIFDAFYRFGDLDGAGGVDFEIEKLVHDATRFADEEAIGAAHLGGDAIAFVWASEDAALEPDDATGGFGVATRTFDPADVRAQHLQLNITAALQDDDGSEVLDTLTLSGAPDGFQFRRNGEILTSDGLEPVALDDLQASETVSVFAPAGFDGGVTLNVNVTSVETATGESAAADRNVFQNYFDGSPFIDL